MSGYRGVSIGVRAGLGNGEGGEWMRVGEGYFRNDFDLDSRASENGLASAAWSAAEGASIKAAVTKRDFTAALLE